MWRRLRGFLLVLAGTLMIMSVVAVNGSPSVFTDTDDYYTEGQSFAYTIFRALHLKPPPPTPTTPEEIADKKQVDEDTHFSHTEIGARSPYYGLLLYATQWIGTIWLTATLQAIVGAWLVMLLWRTAAPGAPLWTGCAVQAATAAGSSLPFFAAFAMPDVFAGYTALAGILLLTFWERLWRWERVALALLLGVAITFHTSHLLNTLGILALGAGLMGLLRAPRGTIIASVTTIGGAVVLAMLANATYKEAVRLKTGDEMRRPPFLALRVTADGPGREYLRAVCDKTEHYALCQFRNLPLDNAQDMLWSDNRKKGVFNVTTFETRLQMEREETRFVINAVLYDPIGQFLASMENWGEQLTMIYVDDPLMNPHYFLTNDYWSTTNLPWLIRHARGECGRDHWGCAPALTIDGSTWLHGSVFVVGLVLIGWRLVLRDIRRAVIRRRFDWGDDGQRLAMLLLLLAAAVLVNAFVCGALSGPFARYQARIAWLIVAGAAVATISLAPAVARSKPPAWVLVRLARLRAWAPVQAVERRIDPTFIRFGLVGAAGFTVDAAILHGLTGLAGFNYFTGRLVSFSVAVLATWLLNRTFTFRHPTHHGPLRQMILYAAVQGSGGLANIGVYTVAIMIAPMLRHALLIPLALGSIAGLCLTFVGSKHLAFRPAAAERPLAADRA